MKRRVLGVLLAVGLMVGSVFGVQANPSKEAEFDITDDSKEDGYEIEETDEEYPELPEDHEDKVPVTPVIQLKGEEDPTKDKYEVTFEVPFLTDGYFHEPGVFYYDEETGEWVYLEPTEVDYENKTVTFEFDSPNVKFFMVMDGEVIDDKAEGTAPQTGVESNWGIWLGAAVVFAGAAVVLTKKKKSA